MSRVEIDGLQIAYTEQGDGPPLILLHGFITDKRMWRTQLSGLSDGFRVIAWDMPGAGDSSDPPDKYRMSDYATCLAALLDALGVASACVLGLSWGGVLAQEFYRAYPERVKALILADTYAGWKGSLGEAAAEERLAGCICDSELRPSEFVPKWRPQMHTAAASAACRAEMEGTLGEFHPAGFRNHARAVAGSDTGDVLPSIAVPTLLLWGAEDQRAPRHVAEAMRAMIPDAQLVVIEGAGHVSNMEQPERFNSEVRAFLTSIPEPQS
jgi:pimeloyl-ACP methyl ester carboxylesterase